MRYHVLAVDYDGTLATGGRVGEKAVEAVKRLRESGRKTVLVSGRPLEDLIKLFPQIGLFDRVLAENGALLYNPQTQEEELLGPPVPDSLVKEMERRNLPPFHIGRAIINAYEPYDQDLLEIIHSLGLEWHLVYNKGSVMVLPSGVNKASGLTKALDEIGFSRHNTVVIGDAENDHHMLRLAEVAVAVANALPAVQQHADLVTQAPESAGVIELINRILATDLSELSSKLARHELLLGHEPDGSAIRVPPYGLNLLISGEPMSGKTTLARDFLKELAEHEYQFCIFDPEGDHLDSDLAVPLGNETQAPAIESVMNLLEKVHENCTINMLAIPFHDRPKFFQKIFAPLQALRRETGRPHWIIIDEAHHLLPTEWASVPGAIPEELKEFLLVTPSLNEIAPAILKEIDLFLTMGTITDQVLEKLPPKDGRAKELLGKHPPGEAVAWWKQKEAMPIVFQARPPSENGTRHRRKYAQARLPVEQVFYFRGPAGRLNLKAENLVRFIELAEGVDDETWMYHLLNGDVTKWFQTTIKDPELAQASQQAVEEELDPEQSRELIRKMIEERYTGPI